MILCHLLDCRNDGDVSVKDDVPSPKQLREKCLTVAKEVIRYLGDSLGTGGVENPLLETFQSVYAGCLGVGEGELLLHPILALIHYVRHAAGHSYIGVPTGIVATPKITREGGDFHT